MSTVYIETGVIQNGGELSKSAGDLRFCAASIAQMALFLLREVPGTSLCPQAEFARQVADFIDAYRPALEALAR